MSIRPTLVVLAAGMGSRYGSLKQLEKFGPSGETIIEYSVYDAIKAGFGNIVFVIRQTIEEDFNTVLLPKFSGKIAVDYVLQELDILPEGYTVPDNREKPWGTGHAVWVAGTKIKNPFAVINGDDFYGYESFKVMADFLKQDLAEQFGLVGFLLKNTLSEHGAVARGICDVDENGYLRSITEQIHITKTAEGITVRTADGHHLILTGNEVVSMNLMGFPPTVFALIEKYFIQFLEQQAHNPKAEFFLPAAVDKLVQAGKARVKVLPTAEKWFGVTYPDDKPVVLESLRKLINQGVYPQNLWHETLKSAEII